MLAGMRTAESIRRNSVKAVQNVFLWQLCPGATLPFNVGLV